MPARTVPPTRKPTYTGKCDENSPYGFTTVNADATLIALYRQMGICWVRYQIHVKSMLSGGGIYWGTLDSVVALMNSAGIHLDVPIQCFQGSCFKTPSIPTPAEMASFASQIATRYNGQNGHGYIDSFEIGNEEYDQNRKFAIDDYGPILKAGYQAIKAASPHAQVGMYGTFPSNPFRTMAVLESIFEAGFGQYMDFMNFHYYNQGLDPRVDADSTHPSFDHKWQLMHTIATRYGFASKPIWVTEIGWPLRPMDGRSAVTPDQQAQYLTYVTDQSANSGVIQKIFWYTIDYGYQPNNIYPPSGPMPAFYALKEYVRSKPVW
ncbi:glycosyl hydrolase [Ktedonosporobacter rubrisoli]|uniref:glycosyl hydrolase n=1 Tax=Ktedonosporobacter rubrisoli TaxID=2509675 RepID=UPI0013EE835A|nr:glycosyl hydrolase [Ktedonosporobacter rubrisoli]